MPRTGRASIEYKPDYNPIPENLRTIREPIVLNATDAALISDKTSSFAARLLTPA